MQATVQYTDVKHTLLAIARDLAVIKDAVQTRVLEFDKELFDVNIGVFIKSLTSTVTYISHLEHDLHMTQDELRINSTKLNESLNVLAMIHEAATDKKWKDGETLPVETLNAVVAMRQNSDSDLLDLMESGLYLHTEDVRTESQGWIRAWVTAFNGPDGFKRTMEAPTVRSLLRSIMNMRNKEINDRAALNASGG